MDLSDLKTYYIAHYAEIKRLGKLLQGMRSTPLNKRNEPWNHTYEALIKQMEENNAQLASYDVLLWYHYSVDGRDLIH